VNNEAPETPEEELIIIETLAPYVYQNGELVHHARVIIGTLVKEAKKNNEIIEENVVIRKDEIERMMKYAKIL
jgi:hypothetical protein